MAHSSEATLATMMEKPNVDWEAAEGDVGGGGETLRVDWWMVNGHHPPDAIDFKVFGGADLAGMWPEARTVVFEINTGAVDKLFYNPYHLQQVGIPSLVKDETVFGACAFLEVTKPQNASELLTSCWPVYC